MQQLVPATRWSPVRSNPSNPTSATGRLQCTAMQAQNLRHPRSTFLYTHKPPSIALYWRSHGQHIGHFRSGRCGLDGVTFKPVKILAIITASTRIARFSCTDCTTVDVSFCFSASLSIVTGAATTRTHFLGDGISSADPVVGRQGNHQSNVYRVPRRIPVCSRTARIQRSRNAVVVRTSGLSWLGSLDDMHLCECSDTPCRAVAGEWMQSVEPPCRTALFRHRRSPLPVPCEMLGLGGWSSCTHHGTRTTFLHNWRALRISCSSGMA